MNPGRARHRATFYRRAETAVEDSHGREVRPWKRIAGPLAAELTTGAGQVLSRPDGQEVATAARVRVRAVDARSVAVGDGVSIVAGRAARRRYIVQGVSSGDTHERHLRRWDELELEDTDEEFEES